MTNDFICLGTLVKVHSNGVTGKDLRDTNGDVRARNDPNVDRSRVGGTVDTRTFRWSVIVARRPLVDELLVNGGIQHGKSSCEEAGADGLMGAKSIPIILRSGRYSWGCRR